MSIDCGLVYRRVKSPRLFDRLNTMPTVYHYTSFETGCKIIENSELWFTHIDHLNDPKELILGAGIYLNVVKALKVSETDPNVLEYLNHIFLMLKYSLVKKNKPSHELLGEYVKDGLKVENIEAAEDYRNLADVYVFSFSKPKDNLKQWVQYSDKCTGLALGFHMNKMFDCTVEVKDVAYVDESEGISSAKAFLKYMCSAYQGLTADEREAFLLNSLNEILYRVISTKSKSWEDEGEVRAIKICLKKDNLGDVCFRPMKSKLVPYLKVRVPKVNIIDVKMGPSVDFYQNQHTFLDFLKQKGMIHTAVTKSNIHYSDT